jgi:hypothetical protein
MMSNGRQIRRQRLCELISVTFFFLPMPTQGVLDDMIGDMWDYLGTKTLCFPRSDELEEYIFVKQRGIISLRRSQGLLPTLEEYYRIIYETQTNWFINAECDYSEVLGMTKEEFEKAARISFLVVQHAVKVFPHSHPARKGIEGKPLAEAK